MKNDKIELNDIVLENVTGGMSNPVAGEGEEQAHPVHAGIVPGTINPVKTFFAGNRNTAPSFQDKDGDDDVTIQDASPAGAL